MAAERLERTQYAGGASGTATTLRSESLRDAAFWRAMARLEGGDGWGVVSGLEVSAAVGDPTLTVTPGVARDAAGELISLARGGYALLGGAQVPVGAAGLDVPVPTDAGVHVLTVAFGESDDTDHPNAARIRHTPVLATVAEDDLVDDGSTVVLARVRGDGTSVADLDAGTRRALGLSVATVRFLRPDTAAAGGARTVAGAAAGEVRALDDGLGLRAGAGADQLRVSADEVDVAVPLSAAGDVAVGGRFTARGPVTAGAALAVTGAFSAGTDASVGGGLTVGRGATVGGELAVGGRLRAGAGAVVTGDGQVTGTLSTGALSTGADASVAAGASIGGAATVTGVATVGSDLHVGGGADVAGGVAVGGDVAVGGRHAVRGTDSWLRLNQDGAFTSGVHTPHLLTANSINVGIWTDPGGGNLAVGGNASLGGDLILANKRAVRGNDTWLRLNQDGAFTSGTHTPHLFTALSVNIGQWTDPGANNLNVVGAGYFGSLTVSGDVVLGAADRYVYIGGNQTGRFMRFHDDLWFCDPQDGTITLENAVGGVGTMRGIFKQMCSREGKQDVEVLAGAELDALHDDALRTDVVRYRYRDGDGRTQLGVIVEDCPPSLVAPGDVGLSPIHYAAMLHGALKVLAARLARLERTVLSAAP